MDIVSILACFLSILCGGYIGYQVFLFSRFNRYLKRDDPELYNEIYHKK